MTGMHVSRPPSQSHMIKLKMKNINRYPVTLIKELRVEKLLWNLCCQLLKKIKSVVFILKFSFLVFLTRTRRN